MDINVNKLYEYSQNKTFTDATLVICDGIHQIRMDVHKNILASHSEYFYKLFTFNDNQGSSEYSIQTENAEIYQDVVNMLYGQIDRSKLHDFQYVYGLLACCDQLLLPKDASLLYDVQIHANDFNILFEMVQKFDIINYPKLLDIIRCNMPLDYNLDNTPLPLVQKLVSCDTKLVFADTNDLKVLDISSGNIYVVTRLNNPALDNVITKFSRDNSKIIIAVNYRNTCPSMHILDNKSNAHFGWIIPNRLFERSISDISISHDHLKIVTVEYYSIKIWNGVGEMLLIFGRHRKYNRVELLSDDKVIVCSEENHMEIWSILNEPEIIASHHFETSNDSALIFQKIVNNDYSGTIDALNIMNYITPVNNIKYTGNISSNNSCMSVNNKILITYDLEHIYVYDTVTGELTHTIESDYINEHLVDCAISDDGIYIISVWEHTIHAHGYIRIYNLGDYMSPWGQVTVWDEKFYNMDKWHNISFTHLSKLDCKLVDFLNNQQG
jgi:hypothetical protein